MSKREDRDKIGPCSDISVKMTNERFLYQREKAAPLYYMTGKRYESPPFIKS